MKQSKKNTDNTSVNKPTHRVSFTGIDDDGNNIVGSAREIGAIWPRKSGGGILRLDHIPVELTQHQGVIFISDISSD